MNNGVTVYHYMNGRDGQTVEINCIEFVSGFANRLLHPYTALCTILTLNLQFIKTVQLFSPLCTLIKVS